MAKQKEKVYQVEEVCFPCVYELIRKGEVIYVGSTCNGLQRVLAHKNTKYFDTIRMIPCPHSELLEKEAEHIIEKQPPYNCKLPYLGDKYISVAKFKQKYGYENGRKFHKFLRENNLKPQFQRQYLLEDLLKAREATVN